MYEHICVPARVKRWSSNAAVTCQRRTRIRLSVRILRVWVAFGPTVYRYKGDVYDRVADADVRLRTDDQISALYLRKRNTDIVLQAPVWGRLPDVCSLPYLKAPRIGGRECVMWALLSSVRPSLALLPAKPHFADGRRHGARRFEPREALTVVDYGRFLLVGVARGAPLANAVTRKPTLSLVSLRLSADRGGATPHCRHDCTQAGFRMHVFSSLRTHSPAWGAPAR